MAKHRKYVQKWLFEIRFDPRPSMFSKGAELADCWAREFPELQVELPRYRLTDRTGSRVVAFGYNNAVVEAEGVPEFKDFVPLARRLAADVANVVHPTVVSRLGLREYHLIRDVPTEVARTAVLGTFFNPASGWQENAGRDEISDVAIVLEFMSQPPFQGRVQFGPYVPSTNQQFFSFLDLPGIKGVSDGLIFDCDFGELDTTAESLAEDRLQTWLYHATEVSYDRVAKLCKAMDIEG